MTNLYRKKLIDVSLPLEAINVASSSEKSIRHGHPSTLHLWWARRPLAACRAILFASLIDDPSENKEKFRTEADQERERKRLLDLLEKFVKWENSRDDEILSQIFAEIREAGGGPIPPVRDPFCGGGSIPLEAQRLGLYARSSDLNPVAVLITKGLIEIPPKFVGLPPVAPRVQQPLVKGDWKGAQGLARDIQYYGEWMLKEAQKQIAHLYPTVQLPPEHEGKQAPVIAWLWARTVTCPNPACGAQMPLVHSFLLSQKMKTIAAPRVDYTTIPPSISFDVTKGAPRQGTVNNKGATCIVCDKPVSLSYIRSEGRAHKMSRQLMAVVAKEKKRRVYLSPTLEHSTLVERILPVDVLDTNLPERALSFSAQIYGLTRHKDLFTARQLVTLATFSDLIQNVREKVVQDALEAGMLNDEKELNNGGRGATAYADAIATYLALMVNRLADRNSTLCSWDASRDSIRNTFARQAISIVWDFAEANPLGGLTGSFLTAMRSVAKVIKASPAQPEGESRLGSLLDEQMLADSPKAVYQRDAIQSVNGLRKAIISTDPPYYDNIGYADLSDFFYVWLRRSLRSIYPDLFATTLTPKENELVANPFRLGGKEKAKQFFETHLRAIFKKMHEIQDDAYPLTLFYAFKQAEVEVVEEADDGTATTRVASTGWETMLESLTQAGFTITGTWPIRTEMSNRSVSHGTNALSSSIVLVCRPRRVVRIVPRRQFLDELRTELGSAVKMLQHSNIAPVDLAQASIGPGMAIYTRYSQVMESDGSALSVRTALQLINRELDSILAEQEGEYDVETRWSIAWFEEHAMNIGNYGRAEILSKAKNTSIGAMQDAAILDSKGGKVRLLKRDEIAEKWDPERRQFTTWGLLQRTIHALEKDGEQGASAILAGASQQSEIVRDLAYRLYQICDRKEWRSEGFSYNALVTAWSAISNGVSKILREPQQMQFS